MGNTHFSDDFKRDAVRQISEQGYPVKEVWSDWGLAGIRSTLEGGSLQHQPVLEATSPRKYPPPPQAEYP